MPSDDPDPSQSEARSENDPSKSPEQSGEDVSPEAEGNGAETDTEQDESDASYESVTDVETIVLDPEDVVQAVAYNGQEDIGQKQKTVFSLSAPFAATVEPSIRHLEEDSKSGKADDEIHIRPFRFVAKGRQVIEQRPTRSLAAEELEGEDHDDATIEAWIDEAMETWKDHVRSNLVDTVDIYSSHGMAFVDVEYRSED